MSMVKKEINNMMNALSYDDVMLIPKYSSIRSRKDPKTHTLIGNVELDIPIISSPMDTITEHKMAIEIIRLGGMAMLHRFMPVERQIDEVKKIFSEINKNKRDALAVAIGIGDAEVDRLKRLKKELNIKTIVIDVANGHTDYVLEMMKQARNIAGNKDEFNIIAGNVATSEGYEFLMNEGANAVRVGIGGGSICKTRIQTGCGVPTLTSVMSCYLDDDSRFPIGTIIADGGIRYPGDMVKALAAGASGVILGRAIAATAETPGELLDVDGDMWKVYRGMASSDIQVEKMGGLKKGTCAEGVSTRLRYAGPVEPIIDEYIGGLRSAMTYLNSMSILSLREAEFIRITQSGLEESHAFGTRK